MDFGSLSVMQGNITQTLVGIHRVKSEVTKKRKRNTVQTVGTQRVKCEVTERRNRNTHCRTKRCKERDLKEFKLRIRDTVALENQGREIKRVALRGNVYKHPENTYNSCMETGCHSRQKNSREKYYNNE